MPNVLKIPKIWGITIATSMLVGIVVTITLIARKERDVHRREVYNGILEYIDTSLSKNEIIGFVSSDRSYLFYGKELNRKVLFIPSKSNSLPEWLNVIRERGINIVAIGPLQTWMSNKEVSWLENPNGPFTRVFGQDPRKEPTLYRLKRGTVRGHL
ncbi:MAG: hypothetical protein JOZ78_16705 [Chroococcidiopsidaceae cyanobacterium CP_BM_ER_R8_30]|nr:hypothetical protein [Chroococcidiopsidaceae cyanobacterium CP_BM_ER_R8_30]